MTDINKQRQDAERHLNDGLKYCKQENWDKAIAALKQVPNNPKDEYVTRRYAIAQFNLGVLYDVQGNREQTIAAYNNVPKQVAELYAQAQFNLGVIYKERKDWDNAIAAYKNVPKDVAEPYAKAQFNLGLLYDEQEDWEKAIAAYNNVPKEVTEQYAKAQFNLGVIYQNQEDWDNAIAAYNNVPENVTEPYAMAQFNLGVIYQNQQDWDNAIAAYNNVPEEVAELYAGAQFNLGLLYQNQQDWDNAIAAYNNVPKEVTEQYAKAQFNLGVIYQNQQDWDNAIAACNNVPEEVAELYAGAQLNLGLLYQNQQDWDNAIAAYNNVPKDVAKPYAMAQVNLGMIYQNQEDWDNAIAAYNNVPKEVAEIYAMAQVNLGEIYLQQDKLDEILKLDKKIILSYQMECITKIAHIKNHRKDLKDLKDLTALFVTVNEILTHLQVTNYKYESKVAHYTRCSTAYYLLKKDKPSAFRLSTINGVNDPTEGQLLNQYVNLPDIHQNPESFSAFISCFTFNHDSLNQFRLYGKENGKEASGVSLVFQKDFFSTDSVFNCIATSQIATSQSEDKAQPSKKDSNEQNKNSKRIPELPLYRCIYIDPESQYLALAARDKITFFREYGKNNENKWEEYQKELVGKTEKVKDRISSIQKMIKKITDSSNQIDANNPIDAKTRETILETINFILMPLQYLVKHAAFQEEQECRIFYITEYGDERIIHEFENNAMYIEYSKSPINHLEKMYFSSGAKSKVHDFKHILKLHKKDVGKIIRISNNPFRHKE